jgi:hypothetical protein
MLQETWRLATSGVEKSVGGGTTKVLPDLDVAIRALEGIIALRQGRTWTRPETWTDLAKAPPHVQEAFRAITRYFADPRSYLASFRTRQRKQPYQEPSL